VFELIGLGEFFLECILVRNYLHVSVALKFNGKSTALINQASLL